MNWAHYRPKRLILQEDIFSLAIELFNHHTSSMTPDELREEVELAVVQFIKEKLASGEVTEERAEQISKRALDILQPGMSFEALYKAIASLDDAMPELSVVVIPYVRDYEENVTKQALDSVRDLISQGQYDAAAKLGAKAARSEVELEWSGSSDSDDEDDV